MYFVDRKKMEERLRCMEQMLAYYKSKDSWDEPLQRLALERIAHVVIEAVLDVGNAMIDGFIMRDPGSYDDIIDILADEQVITPADAEQLKAFIAHRKMLVHDYTGVDHAKLRASLDAHLPALETYPKAVRDYLENELGPVSAFRN
ncbi:type VII toxin-antitoxin system HepT family RNase toxin [Geobacillus subterraneus]|uniref:type VII toxin-antitoxin system HepT family RNase toxin n=1 Tax=Geobacillus subterraneus TaxID=129338 RepID=UPI00161EA5CC